MSLQGACLLCFQGDQRLGSSAPVWMPGGCDSPAIVPELWRNPQRTLVSQSALMKVRTEGTYNSTTRRSVTNP